MPWRSYTGASGKVTWAGRIRPTPTQMLEGTQLYSALGETTVTVSRRGSHLLAKEAAVWPAIPPPSTTTLLMCALHDAWRARGAEGPAGPAGGAGPRWPLGSRPGPV